MPLIKRLKKKTRKTKTFKSLKKESRIERKTSFQVLFDRIALHFFGHTATRLARRINLDKKIKQAGLQVHPVVYMSRQLLKLAISLIVSGFLLIIGTLILLSHSMLYFLIFTTIVIMLPIILFTSGFIMLNSRISERRNGVNSELPFFASYLSSMSIAGLSPEKVIETVAKIKTFKYIREEARLILRNMEIFGMDPLTAIEDVVRDHPSKAFRDFMMGYVTAVRSGGDVRHYLELRTQSYFIEKERELESIAGKVGAILDSYIAIFVLAGITVNIMFASQGALSSLGSIFGGLGDISLLYFFNFLVLPLISVLMIVIVSSILPKYPVAYLEPYIALMYSIPLGIVIASSLMLFGGEIFIRPSIRGLIFAVLAVGTGITISLIPPYIMWRRIENLEKGLVENFASFLQDLSEVRKTGLSPERSILYLASRPYGSFTPILKRIATALYVGMDMYKAVKIALLNYKNWFIRAVMRFLIDAIEYGGGTPSVIDSIASFGRKLADIELGLRKSLKSRVFMPYLGVILQIVTILLVIMLSAGSVTMLSQPVARMANIKVGIEQITQLTFVLTTGVLINAVFAGLLVGKASTMTMAGGFKHAILMVIISMIGGIISIQLFLAPILTTQTP